MRTTWGDGDDVIVTMLICFFVYDSVGILGILHGRHEKRLDCDEIRDIRKRTRDLASRHRCTTPLRFRQTEPRVGEKEKWKCSSDICAMGESVSSPSPPSRSCTQSLRPRRGHTWVLTRLKLVQIPRIHRLGVCILLEDVLAARFCLVPIADRHGNRGAGRRPDAKHWTPENIICRQVCRNPGDPAQDVFVRLVGWRVGHRQSPGFQVLTCIIPGVARVLRFFSPFFSPTKTPTTRLFTRTNG